jgi:hypothetical protein
VITGLLIIFIATAQARPFHASCQVPRAPENFKQSVWRSLKGQGISC